MDSFTLAQNYDIDLILPDLMSEEMTGDQEPDPLLEQMPLEYEDVDLIKYDQYENGYGLLSLRGLGGEPEVVPIPGFREYVIAPGYYGERAILNETEMTKNREAGTPNLPADLGKRLGIMTQYQADKAVNRIRQTLADLLRTGRFVNKDSAGKVTHADQIEGFRTFSPAIGWAANPSTAVPVDDMLSWQNTLQLGTSSRFGEDAVQLCQQSVLNDLFATTQIRNVFKNNYGATPLGLNGLNGILTGFGLPKIVAYNAGYYPTLNDSINRTNFTRILPVKSMIWLGTRPKGQKIGRFKLTRNVPQAILQDADFTPKMSRAVADYQWAEGLGVSLYLHSRLPYHYELDVWFNGGPVPHYGSAAAGISYT